MDLHSKMTMYVTSTMTSPVTKTAKTSKWLRLKLQRWKDISNSRTRPKVLISNVSYFCLPFLFSGRV